MVNKLSFPLPIEAPYEIWLIGPVVFDEKMFEACGRRMDDDGRTKEPSILYKLTYVPKGSGELKIPHTEKIRLR